MSEVAIRVAGLSKKFHIGEKQSHRPLRESIAAGLRACLPGSRRKNQDDPSCFWALNDLSFEVKQGEVLGVIGRNGAGKSTLLKILSRITEPTHGYAEIRGQVGCLLEVGTGFHPELNGRENIYLNGAILGMRRSEIDSRLDEIVAFAEVEHALDTPVKHYSSGMYLRLAFAVAAHLEPEVLLVDEVLAVGDAAFQKKCLGKMTEVSRQGRTVLFVSHNMAAIRQLCGSALLLGSGGLSQIGKTDEVIRTYLAGTCSDAAGDLSHIRDRQGDGRIRLSSVRFEDETGFETGTLVSGQSARIVLGFSSEGPMRRLQACVAFLDTLNQHIVSLNSEFLGANMSCGATSGELVCEIPRVHLAPGRYRLEAWIKAADVLEDKISNAGTIEVMEGNFFGTGRAMKEGFQVAVMDFAWKARTDRDSGTLRTAESMPAVPNRARRFFNVGNGAAVAVNNHHSGPRRNQ